MDHGGKRIMISACKSGSGKTTVTLALLAALKIRGLNVRAFKCGPDYIDPLFHKKVLGIPSGNLDPFFQDKALMCSLFAEGGRNADISVIEGVMGYYDGISFGGAEKSSYECALNLNCPVILVLDGKGMSYSIIAVLKGMKELRQDSNIKGVILNNIPERLYDKIKPVIEKETDIIPLGFMPHLRECELESRHLGLLSPSEIKGMDRKVMKLAEEAGKNLDIERIIELSGETGELQYKKDFADKLIRLNGIDAAGGIRIGIARDEAFSFIYEENLDFLKKCGAELVFFSPLHDKELPDDIDGCIFYGGYPELYAEGLSGNRSMLLSVKAALEDGLPAFAECGGFLYLHEEIEDNNGISFPMTGFIKGARAVKRNRLKNFGYKLISGEFKAHEFHYYESTAGGEGEIKRIKNTLCGFPHYFYYAAPSPVKDFLELCRDRKRSRAGQ